MSAPEIILHPGDCLDVLDTLPADHFDAVVTDPPYHLTSIVKRFGKPGSAPAGHGTDGNFARSSRGFMGKEWDGGDIAFRPETWAKVLRVMKPGAHLVAFNHSRTWHRMAVAIEDAGFDLRDTLAWLYGSGFPKSHDTAKALEKAGATPEDIAAWRGWGTALKPGFEPIVLARKPLAETSVARQALATGTGPLHIEAARVPAERDYVENAVTQGVNTRKSSYAPVTETRTFTPAAGGRWPANVVHDGSRDVVALFPVDPVPGNKAAFQSTSRIFYAAKASAEDRRGSGHPTVKPQALMRWLVRLTCRPGGRILDPFAGSGATAWAAHAEGASCDLIEREAEYQADIARVIAAIAASTDLAAPSPDALPGQASLFDFDHPGD